MQTLEELKKHFTNELVHQDLRRVFYTLRQNIDNQCLKYDDLNLLHARYITASHDQNIKGILSNEEARLIFNQLNVALLDFINNLSDNDLNLKPSATPVTIPAQVKDVTQKTNCNKGKILYKVPGVMELKKERKCIVRIAFDEKELEINNLENEGSKVEPIRIADVMEVNFIDQCPDNAFKIRTISSAEQLVDRGDFTEWIFYVEPLLPGVYDLLLKVSVIEKRLGREIRKDIVLEKKIEVVADAVEANDRLGIYANSKSKMAIGAGFVIPSGFELWDQSVILDSFFLPPLDPGTNPPPPTSTPYLPTNEAASIGWLVFATIALIVLVAYFYDSDKLKLADKGGEVETKQTASHYLTLNDTTDLKNDALLLAVKGNHPPFYLTLKKESNAAFSIEKKIYDLEPNQFTFASLGLTQGVSENFKATLVDSKDSSIISDFLVYWKIPEDEDNIDTTRIITNSPLEITAIPSSNNKLLGLEISNGYLPFQVTITDEKYKKWPFSLIKATDTTLLLQSLKQFPKEGNFKVEVLDMNKKMASDNFSLTMRDELILKTTVDENAEKLTIKVNGNRPPFKVYLDKKQITNYEVKFSNKNLRGKRKVSVSVQDSNGNTKTKEVKLLIGINPIIPPRKPKPPIVSNCVPPEQLKNTCALVYIFNEVTSENWKMQTETFSDSDVIKKLNDDFTTYYIDRSKMDSNCGNDTYTNLQNANAFIFQGLDKEPISFRGIVDPIEFSSNLICFNPKGPTKSKEKRKRLKGFKSLEVQLTPDVTYQIKNNENKKGYSIVPAEESYRVQIAAFKDGKLFNRFVRALEDLDYTVYVQTDTTYFRVYFGDFGSTTEADLYLKELKKDTKLAGILEKEKIIEMLVPSLKI